jgi:plasmid stabilization system protein ParE
MTVRFHPAALAELRETRLWYEERSPLSASAFAREIAFAVSRFAKAPGRFPQADHGTRKVALRRFPYNLFVRVGAEEAVVVAVAHQKRRPGYWSGRLSSGMD